jgi:hypothetical protein
MTQTGHRDRSFTGESLTGLPAFCLSNGERTVTLARRKRMNVYRQRAGAVRPTRSGTIVTSLTWPSFSSMR